MKCATRCDLFQCAIPSSFVTSFRIRTIRTLMGRTIIAGRWNWNKIKIWSDGQDHLDGGQYKLWIGPSVLRTILGDRLDYLAMDKIIMIFGPPHYYDNCGLSNAVSLIKMYIFYSSLLSKLISMYAWSLISLNKWESVKTQVNRPGHKSFSVYISL